MTNLSERTMKDVCECESCGNTPLAHMEKCKVCNSSAYHKTIKSWSEDEEINIRTDSE